MSTAAAAKRERISFTIAGEVVIPSWVTDQKSFRRWARTDQYPDHGWISYLRGDIWVDMSMEELLFHNQVKGEIAYTIMSILKRDSFGRYVHDRMLLTNLIAGLSTEPDGIFFFWDTVRKKRIRQLARSRKIGYLELEGTPDMVLEVVSDTSVKKDLEILVDLYWRAGITEYWIVDARGDQPSFEIYRHRPRGYAKVTAKSGWRRSAVFKRSFKFVQEKDPLGDPQFALLVRKV